MKLLIIAQLGQVDATSTLSDRGKAEMAKLGECLKPLLRERAIRIVTSPAIAAGESANILAAALYAREIVLLDCLYSSPYQPPNLDATVDALLREAETTEVLVVVTHPIHVRDLPSRMCQTLIGRAYPEKLLPPGTAIIIAPETRSVSIVS